MNKLMNVEKNRYNSIQKMKEKELNKEDITSDYEYLKYLNQRLEVTAEEFYHENPFFFQQRYRELEKKQSGKKVMDLLSLTEEETYEYAIYLALKKSFEKRNRKIDRNLEFIESQKLPVYMKFLEEAKQTMEPDKYLDLKYLLYFIEPKFFQSEANAKRIIKEAEDIRLAKDRIRVLETQDLYDRINSGNLTDEEVNIYRDYINIMIDQIENERLRIELKKRLMLRPVENTQQIVKKSKERITI